MQFAQSLNWFSWQCVIGDECAKFPPANLTRQLPLCERRDSFPPGFAQDSPWKPKLCRHVTSVGSREQAEVVVTGADGPQQAGRRRGGSPRGGPSQMPAGNAACACLWMKCRGPCACQMPQESPFRQFQAFHSSTDGHERRMAPPLFVLFVINFGSR